MAKYKLTKSIAVLTTALILSACTDYGQDTETVAQTDPKADIEQLMHEAKEARAHADQLGFEWSVTKPLLDEAEAAYAAGDHEKARTLYQEVKHQAMLAVEQAHYAEKHWQLLIPGK